MKQVFLCAALVGSCGMYCMMMYLWIFCKYTDNTRVFIRLFVGVAAFSVAMLVASVVIQLRS